MNTSRGPIVTDLLDALESNTIAGAAIDVYDQEPPAADHPFRCSPKLLATPHIGFVSRDLYKRFRALSTTSSMARKAAVRTEALDFRRKEHWMVRCATRSRTGRDFELLPTAATAR